MDLSSIPATCALCCATVPFGDTKIIEQPILRANEDGSPKPVYHGMPVMAEFRVCASH